MRALAIPLSALLHAAVVFGALHAPMPRGASSSAAIVEFTVPPAREPLTPAPEPPREEPRHPLERTLAMRTRDRTRPEDDLRREIDLEPSKVAPTTPQSPTAPSPGKIDLNLRALPLGQGIILPAPTASGPPSTNPSPPRGEWRPRGDTGDPLTGKIRETPTDRFPLKSLGRGHFAYSGGGFSAHIHPDGEVSFDDKYITGFTGTTGSFDITDMIMRGRKEDPYRHEKKLFLEATADMRAKLARRLRAERVRGSLAMMTSTLEEIWSGPKSARERRRLLLELWDEIDAGGEDDLEKAGDEARATMLAFVKRRLPVGSPDAFTDEELKRHNGGAKKRFDPYEGP